MRISAIKPDELIIEVREYTNGKNITESLIIALTDWLYIKKINKLNDIL
jgi:hypothetical protein